MTRSIVLWGAATMGGLLSQALPMIRGSGILSWPSRRRSASQGSSPFRQMRCIHRHFTTISCSPMSIAANCIVLYLPEVEHNLTISDQSASRLTEEWDRYWTSSKDRMGTCTCLDLVRSIE